MAVDLGSAFGRIVIDTGGATRSLGGLSSKMGVFGRGAAVPMIAALGAVAAGFGSVVSTTADFDKALSVVAAVSGATATQMNQLREQALRMGQQTVFSAKEVAGAQGELAKAGLSVSEILGGGLKASLSLAAAGELELADAAKFTANAMNLFQLSGKDIPGIADALATAANATTADVADFGMALTQGGAAAKQAGLSFNQTVTILEALAKSGVKNSDAGTSMKAALIHLLAPSKKAAQAMREHNLSLVDAQGNFVGAAEASRRLTTATHGMTAAQRVAFLATVAGTDGFRTLAALIDAGPPRLARYSRELGIVGSAAAVAAKRQDNLRGDTEQLGGAIETLKIRLGTGLTPALRGVTQALTGAISAASDPGAISGLADRLQIGDTVRHGWDALSSVVVAAKPVLLGAGAVVLGIADNLAGLGRAASGAAQLVGPLVTVIATGAAGIGIAAGALISFQGAIVGSAAGTAILTTAVVALTGAYVGVKVAALAAAIATRAVALAGTITAFLQLASTVRSAAGALALLRATTAGSAGLSLLTSPAGLAGAAVAVLAGGIALLASGFFRSIDPATDLAARLKDVDKAARDAAGSIDAMNATVDKLSDAHSRTARSALAVESAERNYATVVRDAGKGSLEAREAAQRLRDARTELARATRDEGKATQGAGAQASSLAQKMAGLIVANENATGTAMLLGDISTRLGAAFGDGGKGASAAAVELGKLERAGASAEVRARALQTAFVNAAAQIRGTGPAAQAAKTQLLTLASLSVGGLKTFVADVKAGTDAGKTKAEATKAAIQKALKGSDTTVDFSQFLAAINTGGSRAEAAMRGWAAKIRAAQRAAAPTAHGSPSAVEVMAGGMRELERTVEQGGERVHAKTVKVALAIHRGWLDAAAGVGDAKVEIETQLAAIDLAESVYERRRDARFALAQARSKLARATSKEDTKAAQTEVAQQIAASRELERQLAQEAADRTRIAALKKAPQAKAALLDKLGTIATDAETAGRDLADKIGTSLEASFADMAKGIDATLSAAVKGIDANLTATLATVDRTLQYQLDALDTGLARTSDAIARGVAVDLSGIANLPDATRAGFDAVTRAVADDVAQITAGEQQQLGLIASTTASVLGQITTALDGALAPLQATLDTATANITAIDAELDKRSQARLDRQQQAALDDAQAAKATLDAEVEKLRAIQAGARTDSERQAATRLLTDALDRQKAAAVELSNAQEDISTTGLERQKAGWQAMASAAQTAKDAQIAASDEATARVNQNAVDASAAVSAAADAARTAAITGAQALATQLADTARLFASQIADTSRLTATSLADQARTTAETAAQAARDALDRRLADVKATLERDLGNLGEALASGNFVAAKRAVDGILGVLNSPDVRSSLNASGLALGVAFSAGLERSTATVTQAATQLASTLASYLKLRSPAERGPLAFDFTRSGLAVGRDLAAGLRASHEAVRIEAARLAGVASLGAGGLAASTPVVAGGVTQNNVFQLQRPVEDLRAWSQRAMYEARLAGGRL